MYEPVTMANVVSENSGRDGERNSVNESERRYGAGNECLICEIPVFADSLFMYTQLHVPIEYSQVRTRTLRL
jgi:hypothetical protein